jgi:hypothetical protein
VLHAAIGALLGDDLEWQGGLPRQLQRAIQEMPQAAQLATRAEQARKQARR